ncbi:hypothetical protein ACHAQH_006511 [Verticillium albo-atrum]
MPLDEHALGAQLPKPSDRPYVQVLGKKFREFETRPGPILTPEDLCYLEEPQFSLFATSFTDQTLVTLSWPHTMTSALGRKSLMQAWALVLAGREDEVPPLDGAEEDVLATLGDVEEDDIEPFVLEDKRLKGLSMARFGLNLVWDMYCRPYLEGRMVFLPATFVSHLYQQAKQDLKASSERKEAPFVSEGDVLGAWA